VTAEVRDKIKVDDHPHRKSQPEVSPQYEEAASEHNHVMAPLVPAAQVSPPASRLRASDVYELQPTTLTPAA
jgi:hypothetical protein